MTPPLPQKCLIDTGWITKKILFTVHVHDLDVTVDKMLPERKTAMDRIKYNNNQNALPKRIMQDNLTEGRQRDRQTYCYTLTLTDHLVWVNKKRIMILRIMCTVRKFFSMDENFCFILIYKF